ncbi:MAG TPA: hypothetical protein DEQ09_07405 [Bacteroidales bacterium]|nr:hypothetical protein [Bacteroidales bacterium]
MSCLHVDGLKKNLNRKADSIYVINFRATWCKPCTEEMPDLLRVERELRSGYVKYPLNAY